MYPPINFLSLHIAQLITQGNLNTPAILQLLAQPQASGFIATLDDEHTEDECECGAKMQHWRCTREDGNFDCVWYCVACGTLISRIDDANGEELLG